jgi:hypothetical protein
MCITHLSKTIQVFSEEEYRRRLAAEHQALKEALISRFSDSLNPQPPSINHDNDPFAIFDTRRKHAFLNFDNPNF